MDTTTIVVSVSMTVGIFLFWLLMLLMGPPITKRFGASRQLDPRLIPKPRPPKAYF
jgi:hypothetical protein